MLFAWPSKESADSAANPGADYSVRVKTSKEVAVANTQLFCGCCSGPVACRFINNIWQWVHVNASRRQHRKSKA